MSALKLPPFRNSALYQQAIAHVSYAKERGQPDNERLEFLGDAILTFLCGEFLYRRYPDRPEGELTPLRAALVDAKQLSHFAQQLGLQTQIKLSAGAEKVGGRRNDRILSSGFEALIGAYFLDSDSIEAVREYVTPLFAAVVDQVAATALETNHKSRLQEWSLGQGWGIPTYRIVSQHGPDHDRTFVAEVSIQGKPCGRGRGKSKQQAEKQAAAAALEQICGAGVSPA